MYIDTIVMILWKPCYICGCHVVSYLLYNTLQLEKVRQRNREYNDYQQWKAGLIRVRVWLT